MGDDEVYGTGTVDVAVHSDGVAIMDGEVEIQMDWDTAQLVMVALGYAIFRARRTP